MPQWPKREATNGESVSEARQETLETLQAELATQEAKRASLLEALRKDEGILKKEIESMTEGEKNRVRKLNESGAEIQSTTQEIKIIQEAIAKKKSSMN